MDSEKDAPRKAGAQAEEQKAETRARMSAIFAEARPQTENRADPVKAQRDLEGKKPFRPNYEILRQATPPKSPPETKERDDKDGKGKAEGAGQPPAGAAAKPFSYVYASPFDMTPQRQRTAQVERPTPHFVSKEEREAKERDQIDYWRAQMTPEQMEKLDGFVNSLKEKDQYAHEHEYKLTNAVYEDRAGPHQAADIRSIMYRAEWQATSRELTAKAQGNYERYKDAKDTAKPQSAGQEPLETRRGFTFRPQGKAAGSAFPRNSARSSTQGAAGAGARRGAFGSARRDEDAG